MMFSSDLYIDLEFSMEFDMLARSQTRVTRSLNFGSTQGNKQKMLGKQRKAVT